MAFRLKISERYRHALHIVVGGSVVTAVYCLLIGDEKFYRQVVLPLGRRVFFRDPERAHKVAVKCARIGALPWIYLPQEDSLSCQLFGRKLPHPVGLAAGFDKDAEAVPGLLGLGFSMVEIGTVTPCPQEGNPRPRVFRLEKDQAVINRYGFNSAGHEVVAQRLSQINSCGLGKLVGVNIGKNKESKDAAKDYCAGVLRLGGHADYLVLNVSSPNTPGLRELQNSEHLRHLLEEVQGARDELFEEKGVNPALVLKLGPEMVLNSTEEELHALVHVLTDDKIGVDGVIVSNTTTERPASMLEAAVASAIGAGGLSGRPLAESSTRAVHRLYAALGEARDRLVIIGCGGVDSGAAAFEKIAAGASAVQLYTALMYQGPPVLKRVVRELEQELRSRDLHSVQSAVGWSHRAS